MENTSPSREISEIPLFAGLSPDELECVSRALEIRRYGNGETLFSEGSSCAGLYLLKLGRVRLLRSSGDKQQLLTLAGPGDPLDLVPLLDEGPHTCSAKARGPVELYVADSRLARDLIWNTPELLKAVMHAVAGGMRLLYEQVGALAFKDVRARVCDWLVKTAEHEGGSQPNGIHVKRTLSQAELAALIGTGREVIWRALKRLEDDGLIAVEREEIVLLQPERLANLV